VHTPGQLLAARHVQYFSILRDAAKI
jgi:hypothetical protein